MDSFDYKILIGDKEARTTRRKAVLRRDLPIAGMMLAAVLALTLFSSVKTEMSRFPELLVTNFCFIMIPTALSIIYSLLIIPFEKGKELILAVGFVFVYLLILFFVPNYAILVAIPVYSAIVYLIYLIRKANGKKQYIAGLANVPNLRPEESGAAEEAISLLSEEDR